MAPNYWKKSRLCVLGAGSWGSVLANLASHNVSEVVLWTRDDEAAKAINSSRSNPKYVKHLEFNSNVRAVTDLNRALDGNVQTVIWALPSQASRAVAKVASEFFTGSEILLHATKGIEQGTLKRMSEILREEIPCPRIGVISGPNLADEVARKEPAATVIASKYEEAVQCGQAVLTTDKFRVYAGQDLVGIEWAGTLKNVLAIAAGSLDALKLGWNTRAMLISRGLAEMVRFGVAMGGEMETFLGLAGVGDLLATASSPLSRNYRVGFGLAQGKSVEQIVGELGSTAEGVKTAISVHQYASERNIYMPITEAVFKLVQSEANVAQVLHHLMTRPPMREIG